MKSIFIILAATILMASAAPQNGEKFARILDQDFDLSPNGAFNYKYETENKISANAGGSIKVLSEKPYEDAQVIQGRFSWISPEGKTVVVEYISDETGYRPRVQVF